MISYLKDEKTELTKIQGTLLKSQGKSMVGSGFQPWKSGFSVYAPNHYVTLP